MRNSTTPVDHGARKSVKARNPPRACLRQYAQYMTLGEGIAWATYAAQHWSSTIAVTVTCFPFPRSRGWKQPSGLGKDRTLSQHPGRRGDARDTRQPDHAAAVAPYVKQRGDRNSSTLVRDEDRYGYFAKDPVPTRDMDPEIVAFVDRRYGGTPLDAAAIPGSRT